VAWETLDYQVFRQSQPFTNDVADGVQVAVLQLPPVPGDQVFRIERVSCYIAANPLEETAGAGLSVPFLIQIFDQWPIQDNAAPCDQTYAGVFELADNSQPITLRESDQASFIFTCDVTFPISAIACVRAQYAILGGAAAARPTPVAGALPGPRIPVSV